MTTCSIRVYKDLSLSVPNSSESLEVDKYNLCMCPEGKEIWNICGGLNDYHSIPHGPFVRSVQSTRKHPIPQLQTWMKRPTTLKAREDSKQPEFSKTLPLGVKTIIATLESWLLLKNVNYICTFWLCSFNQRELKPGICQILYTRKAQLAFSMFLMKST